MPKNILLFLMYALLTTVLTAQPTENNKVLRGKVLFQNSNFTPAVGVSVSGEIKLEKEENTNSVYTDAQGAYQLQFPFARKGHPVKLTIGKEDEKGQELEVVNETEISLCRIPANANEEFDIIVCPKGSRDLAARKYYEILNNSAELAYERMQEQFRALINSQNKDYKTIQEVADDLTKLQNQLSDSIALYKEAMAIASINKDGVNNRVLNYLKLLDEGKNLQEAREALSISKASKDMEKSIKLFRTGVKELEERARASAAVFDYKDAMICYDTLIAKAEKLNIDPLELSGYYLQAGGYDQENGFYRKASNYAEKAIAIREKVLDSLDANLATSYNSLAVTYQDLGLYKKALMTHRKTLKIRKEILEPNHIDMSISYNNLAIVFKNLGLHEEAISAQLQALKIQKAVLGFTNPDVASSYNNLATIYQDLGNYDEALNAHLQTLKIRKVVLKTDHPDLAQSYNNLGTLLYEMKSFIKSIYFLEKAYKIWKNTLLEEHPNTKQAFQNLLFVHKKYSIQLFLKDNYEEALKSLDTVTKYQKDAEAWNLKGLCHYYLKQYPKAINAYQRVIEIDSTFKIKDYYNNIGLAYAKSQQFPEAKAAFTEYQKLFPKQGRPYRNRAMYYALQDQKEEALELLKKAIDLGYKDLKWLETDDSMDNLRNEPRFKALLEQLKTQKPSD